MRNLSQIKPRLRKCSITADGRRLILEDEARARQVSLPIERKLIVDCINGESSIRDIVERLMTVTGSVSFRAVLATLTTLEDAGLLEEPLGLGGAEGATKTPLERDEAFFMRPLLELTLLGSLKISWLRQPVLLIAAALAIAGIAAEACFYWFTHFSARGFFLLPGPMGVDSYAGALPMFFAVATGLLVFKGLAKALALLLTTGQLHRLRLRLHPFGLSVAVSDVSTYGISSHWLLLAYFLAVAPLYLFAAAVAPELTHNRALVRSLEALAILLTFIDLDAYRRSDLTLLIDRFFKDDDARHLTAYLKNRSLFSVASVGKSMRGELRLVVYSSVALLWTVGFLLFSLEMLSSNYAPLFVTAQSGDSLLEKISAGVLLLILVCVFGSLFFDLVSTIASNVVFPMLTPYLRMRQRIHSSQEKEFDRGAVMGTLTKIGFFQDLGPESLRYVVESGKVMNFKRGTRLIIQGEPGRELFVLLKGTVGVLKREDSGLQSRICTLGSGSVFGEIALLKDCVRTADVVAAEDIRVLVVEKEAFRKLLSNGAFKGDYDRILDRIALGHYLASTPLFGEIPAETLGLFRENGKFEHVGSGQVVIREGDADRSFYLVLRGRMIVSREQRPVAELKQGDFFGEIALLGNVARTATVTAAEDSLVLKLESALFWRVLYENLPLAMSLEVIAEQRQAAAGSR